MRWIPGNPNKLNSNIDRLEKLLASKESELLGIQKILKTTAKRVELTEHELTAAFDDLKTWRIYTDDLYIQDIRVTAIKHGITYPEALTYLMIERITSLAKAEQFLLDVQATKVL